MQLEVTWWDIIVRLLVTFAAGAIVGANRSEHGRPAGLRTTVLVCLTASASMILGNLLLATKGKVGDSLVTLDIMRLPLGILTGMGFIGAGAILHRGNAITGVTTAGTLWFTTLMGFCFGAGYISLGFVLLAMAVVVLWCLEAIEARWKQRREATLSILVSAGGPSQEEIIRAVEESGHEIAALALKHTAENREVRLEVGWRASRRDCSPPAYVAGLASRPGVSELRWSPVISQ
jgi:putative Mg2+ transporter-C (MgtC) family protein